MGAAGGFLGVSLGSVFSALSVSNLKGLVDGPDTAPAPAQPSVGPQASFAGQQQPNSNRTTQRYGVGYGDLQNSAPPTNPSQHHRHSNSDSHISSNTNIYGAQAKHVPSAVAQSTSGGVAAASASGTGGSPFISRYPSAPTLATTPSASPHPPHGSLSYSNLSDESSVATSSSTRDNLKSQSDKMPTIDTSMNTRSPRSASEKVGNNRAVGGSPKGTSTAASEAEEQSGLMSTV